MQKKIAESDEMQKNTAQNLETAFQNLDENIENGTAGNVAQFERKAAKAPVSQPFKQSRSPRQPIRANLCFCTGSYFPAFTNCEQGLVK